MTPASLISGLQRLSVCVLVGVALRPPAHGLVIKHEPHVDTELYVAPATYTRKDGKALPSTIIISRPIGVRDEPERPPAKDFPQDALTFVSAADDSREGSIDLKHNIKFYKIECTSGRSCSSIIPAYTTTPPPLNLKPLSDEELKEYLEQFSLRNGFQYSDDFESSGSPTVPEESDFDGEASEERAFGGHSDRGYWPGSRFRPGAKPSRGQVFKYQSVSGSRDQGTEDPFRLPFVTWDQISSDFPSRPINSWDRVSNKRPSNAQSYDRFSTQITRRPSQTNARPQLLKPAAPHDDAILPPSGPPRPPPRPTKRPSEYDGVWNRYGMSTVSQLDRDTGKWVKISSSNTHLDQRPYSEPSRPSDPHRAPTHHASASLTVLGVNDRQPHSFPSHERNSSHTVEVPSALPGNPPETIETGGDYVQSFASVPLSVIAPGLFRPLTPAPASSIETTGVAHVSVPLYLISPPTLTAAISDESNTTTTSSTTTTTTTTTTTARPPPTTTTRPTSTSTTAKPPQQAPAGFFDNPSAVMAAVGAGLIPATFAALLPVFVGGRRRRRRRSVVPDDLGPSRKGSPEEQVAAVSPRVWQALKAHQDNDR